MSTQSDRRIYDALADMLHRAYGFVERTKSGSILMRIIAVLVYPFNQRFTSEYTTTIFGRIYYPDGYVQTDPGDAWRTLAHEGRHLHDAKWVGEPWFSLSYLFPQVLASLGLLALLAIPLSSWWLLNLGWLLALAPWPAPWRARWERNGYLASIVVDIMRGWDVDGAWYSDYMISHFSGWGYYHMVLRRSTAAARVSADIARARALLAGAIKDVYYTPMIATIRAAQVAA